MKLSIFNALDNSNQLDYELTVVTTSDYKNMEAILKNTHIGPFVDRLSDGIASIMDLLNKENKDLVFINVINNCIAVGFAGGLTFNMIINYSRNTVSIGYNLPSYC